MQVSAPEVVDSPTNQSTSLDLFGIGEKETDDFGRRVRVAAAGGKGRPIHPAIRRRGGNGSWDAHVDMKDHEKSCRAVDKPIAGLIRDLKQRGAARFPPWWCFRATSAAHPGRKTLLAGITTRGAIRSGSPGASIKGGITRGETDEAGYALLLVPLVLLLSIVVREADEMLGLLPLTTAVASARRASASRPWAAPSNGPTTSGSTSARSPGS